MQEKQITVKDFIENVYKPTYFVGLAETTAETYRQFCEYNIYPFLGSIQISDVTVKTIQDFYNWMAEGEKHGRKANINADTIRRVGSFLSRILSVAVALKYIPENPINPLLLKNPGKKSKHHTALSEDDAIKARKKIPELKEERQRLFMGLLAYDTGMRPEEILGLRWEDINLEDGYLEIKRTVTYPDKNKPCLREGGKTEFSARTIIVNPALAGILKTASSRTGYVIHGRKSEDIISRSTYERTYREAFKELGIEGKTPYDWRSTFATELCEQGYSTKIIADMMGHSTTRMVEKVYSTKRRAGILANRNIIDQKSEHYFSVS
jgi:integrase